MDGAVAFPEDEVGVLQSAFGIAAEVLARVPNDHLVERVTHRVGGIATEVLVGEEQNLDLLLTALGKCPFEDVSTVGAGADGAVMLAYERLDRGAAVHVRDRDD